MSSFICPYCEKENIDTPEGFVESCACPQSFSWKGKADDKTALYGRYTLRCEMMNKGSWWYAVYKDGEEIWSNAMDSIPICKNRPSAMARAEAVVRNEIIKINQTKEVK